jgi:hypothetical protein
MDMDRFIAEIARVAGPTRRALLSLSLGGSIAGLLTLTGVDARKKRKKRCKKLGQTCSVGGKRRCCHGRTCDIVGPDGLGPTRCCQPNLGLCKQDRDCCGLSTCGGDGTEPRCLGILPP